MSGMGSDTSRNITGNDLWLLADTDLHVIRGDTLAVADSRWRAIPAGDMDHADQGR